MAGMLNCSRTIQLSRLPRAGAWIFLVLLLMAPSGTPASDGMLSLEIHHGSTGRLLYSRDVQAGDHIQFSWIHSVELTPWEEYYEIQDDGTLLLKMTRFQSYGAGVPEFGGVFRKERDWIVYDEIDRRLPELSWIHSHSAKFRIALNESVFIQPTELPHHEPLQLSIRKTTP